MTRKEKALAEFYDSGFELRWTYRKYQKALRRRFKAEQRLEKYLAAEPRHHKSPDDL